MLLLVGVVGVLLALVCTRYYVVVGGGGGGAFGDGLYKL